MSTRMKRSLTVIASLALALVGGVAFAAYLSTGSGTGETVSTSAVASTISSASGGTALYPGATGTVAVTINNPNPYPVKVLTISASSSAATGTGNACAAGTVTTAAVSSAPSTTIAPSGTATYTLSSRMINDPDNSCQGKTFTLPLTATLASAAS